jgi:hypothetical protein
MSPRYSLRWCNDSGDVWHEDFSFNCVGDAKSYAVEHAPDGATKYRITNTADRRFCIERKIGD